MNSTVSNVPKQTAGCVITEAASAECHKNFDGVGLWEAWYLAREKRKEFAMSLCCLGTT